jgi:malic enzyme
MREVATAVALAVARVAYQQGHAAAAQPADLTREIAQAMYQPDYVPEAA